MNKKQITPSLLNVDKNKRQEVLNQLIDLGIKWFHFDVMDNVFVPNKALEVQEIINFQKNTNKKFLSDAHLMVTNPFEYADKLMDYVTCLTIHYESFESEQEIIEFVNKYLNTNWIGISIKPTTNFSKIQSILYLFDIVLVMSVEPGFGGQQFIESTYEKIKEIAEYIEEEKLPTIIQVDGGINDSNSKKIFSIGSTFNVVGSYLMNNLNEKTIKKLK